ncbi:unnamed protein product [Staurois parvus]|uniref:Uncharacterized protein n=1 Tax=Staurois parvus TaxID=386267 RepID=A0ABN9BWS6_9NEOB|nr:unnamed protein product [Staurois parvus]
MGGHTAPYDKMEPTSSVRRPESGTWQSVAMETAAMGGRTGTHDTLWTWQQHEEAVQGAHDRLRAWQQHEESVRGPMADYVPGSSMRRRYRGPWRRLAVEAAVFGSHTQA